MGATAHQFADIPGIGEVILADGARAASVATSVDHAQAVAGVGEWPLSNPFAHPGGKGSVGQDDRLTGTPDLDMNAAG